MLYAAKVKTAAAIGVAATIVAGRGVGCAELCDSSRG
jgi:hypothetical protein